MLRSRSTILALLAVTTLLLAACGGNDTDSTAGESPGTTADGSSDVTAPNVEVGGGFDGSVEACAELASAFVAVAGLPMMGMLGGDALADVEEALADLDARVPSELADEFRIVEGAYAQYADAMGGSTMADIMSDPSVAENMGKAAEAFDDPEVEQAIGTVGQFLEDNCSDFGFTDFTP
jgi:hypothetical protein